MASLKLIQRNKELKDGTFPIVLRIIKNRKKKLISLGLSCKKNEFESQEFKRTHSNYRRRNQVLLKFKNKAYEILDEFKMKGIDFTLDEFESNFRGLNKGQIIVSDFFDEIILEMERAGRIGNAKAYKDTKTSLLKFGKEDLKFNDITSTFLDKYEVHLRETGSKDGGIAFRMREIRSIYNKAINRNIVDAEFYPFKNYKISKLKGKKRKKALSIEDFKKFKDFDSSMNPNLLEAYNYFLFSFYASGMNFVDMMKLKWSDIQNGRIYYERSKTKGRFSIQINSEIQSILDFYEEEHTSSNYVFPILLKDDMTPKQIANRKHKVLARYNIKLKEIARIIGISDSISSYTARHSFATILKFKGTSTDKISELMGHSDVQITMTYLKEFDQKVLDLETDKLLDL